MNAKWKAAGNNREFDGTTITVRIPITFKRRGGRKVIIAPDRGDAWAPTQRSAKLINRGNVSREFDRAVRGPLKQPFNI